MGLFTFLTSAMMEISGNIYPETCSSSDLLVPIRHMRKKLQATDQIMSQSTSVVERRVHVSVLVGVHIHVRAEMLLCDM